MQFVFEVAPATFVARPNRYLVVARMQQDGSIVHAHCPTPGRLGELLIPDAGVTIYLSRSSIGHPRKTAFDLRFVVHPVDGTLISVDTRLPNQIVADALADRGLPPFVQLREIEREVRVPQLHAGGIRSRIDFCGLDADGRRCWIEVKSVTLVEAGIAYFPDAVTNRGRRHLLELIECVRLGDRAAVIFVVQRPDARQVVAQRHNDPAFAAALDLAAASGVELYAWTTTIALHSAELLQPIPVVPGAG
jgi:sugar fermentation stimulation protein A